MLGISYEERPNILSTLLSPYLYKCILLNRCKPQHLYCVYFSCSALKLLKHYNGVKNSKIGKNCESLNSKTV